MLAEQVKPSTITFNSLIDACVRSDKIEKGWKILEEMREMDVQADNYTYSTLFKGIKSDRQVQDLQKAFDLFVSLKENGSFKPDEILFNVLLDACINCK